ncbi:MAG: 50S ribosomal protein L31 [Candidatus Pacebacteria bacterium]|nr:50S ribosomal protein L31 [Candidatus Paceibacterota bacterium]
MKLEIHPEYIENAQIKCVCGNVIKSGSTKKEMHVEICSNCHPFFTGKENLIDIAGRVEKFNLRKKKASEVTKAEKKPRVKKEKASTKKSAK